MGKYQNITKNIPWTSLGKETTISQVGKSLVPIGFLPFETVKMQDDSNDIPTIDSSHPDFENYLMNIVGTAIQANDGKLVTCAHVADALASQPNTWYILSRILREGKMVTIPYRIIEALRFVDPRTDQVNKDVDIAVIIVPAKSTETIPYETPAVRWGDSSKLGVGDQVIIGGYPYGKEMFLFTKTNRRIVQPTFYSGIVSAILPATKPYETRIIQVSIPVAGGMSGGALIDPNTGEVMGMVTSGINNKGIPLPMTYVIPSEIIAPFVEVITFK